MNFKEYFHLQERVEQPNLRPIAEEYYNKIINYWEPVNWKSILGNVKNAIFEVDYVLVPFPFKIELGQPWFSDTKTLPLFLNINDKLDNSVLFNGIGGELQSFYNKKSKTWIEAVHISLQLSYLWVEDFNRLYRASKEPNRIGTQKFVEPHIIKLREHFINYENTVINVLTHELQHWVDFANNPKRSRSVFNAADQLSNIKSPTVRSKIYFNSPDELNAWFRHAISGHNPNHYSTFQAYKKAIIHEYYKAWNRLTKANQQRQLKRLYQYYQQSRLTS